jgi:hypothetical protein
MTLLFFSLSPLVSPFLCFKLALTRINTHATRYFAGGDDTSVFLSHCSGPAVFLCFKLPSPALILRESKAAQCKGAHNKRENERKTAE